MFVAALNDIENGMLSMLQYIGLTHSLENMCTNEMSNTENIRIHDICELGRDVSND